MAALLKENLHTASTNVAWSTFQISISFTENAFMKDITGFSKDLYCHHMYIFTYLHIEV